VAYQQYKDLFASERFGRLANRGARTQRLLWASTSTKDPQYSDVKYVDALIGPDMINTMPRETLEAYRDHGRPAARLEQDVDRANQVLADLSDLGIHPDDVMLKLEQEGIEKFNHRYDKLFETLRKRGARQPRTS
jgi:transaldolase